MQRFKLIWDATTVFHCASNSVALNGKVIYFRGNTTEMHDAMVFMTLTFWKIKGHRRLINGVRAL